MMNIMPSYFGLILGVGVLFYDTNNLLLLSLSSLNLELFIILDVRVEWKEGGYSNDYYDKEGIKHILKIII